jgi:isopenicillin-N epimerase
VTTRATRTTGFWLLEPGTLHLNHGSFGACPRPVLDCQNAWRARLEANPTRFFNRELWPALDEARGALGQFVGAPADDLAFVTNATTGVNTVLRSLTLEPGDELLTTDHAYRACRNALAWAAEGARARLVVAGVPFPLRSADDVLEAVLDRVTGRTRLAVVDHVTSPTALVFPVERLVARLAERGVDTLVDGAHAPGMVPLAVEALGAAYYTGNCHKWLCAPKGAAFLYVRTDRQPRLRPLVISHGTDLGLPGRSRFRLEFDWTGTADPSAWLAVPEAIRAVGALSPGGWPQLQARNRALAGLGRACVCAALGAPPPCPTELLGAMAAVPLPAAPDTGARGGGGLQDALFERAGVVVPVIDWPRAPRRLVRLSAHAYNRPEDYARLAAGLRELLAEEQAAAAGPRGSPAPARG